MIISVASKNPVKIAAAEQAFRTMFPDTDLSMQGVSVASGVADQPMSDEETRRGAYNRAQAALEQVKEAEFTVGLEGGLEEADGSLRCSAWAVIAHRDGRMGESRMATFMLPPEIVKLVREGKELGEADDIVFGRTNSKQGSGCVGLLTDDVIDRATYYEHALILALAPFKNAELFVR